MITSDDFLPLVADIAIAILHSRDSAMLVAQEAPGWKGKYQAALENPLRQHQTETVAVLLRELCDAVVERRLEDPEFRERIAEFRQALRQRPN